MPLFAEASFILERAAAIGIQNIGADVQSGDFLRGHEGTFDLIVCTKMLEHITFNPVAFWRRVWQLLSDQGMIYLTTPNVFRVRALVKSLLRITKFERLDLPVDEILTVVTYGHHWKEYSR